MNIILLLILSFFISFLVNSFILNAESDTFKIKISLNFNILYFITLLIISLTLIILYLVFGYSTRFFIDSVILICLYIIFVIDYKFRIVPDTLNIFMIIFGLTIAYFNPYFLNTGFSNILISIIGIAAGVLLIWFFAFLGEKIFKQEALGGGDIKLFGALGAIFGYQSIFYIFVYSTVVAGLLSAFLIILKIKDRKSTIPFAPFITLATILWMYLQKKIFIN